MIWKHLIQWFLQIDAQNNILLNWTLQINVNIHVFPILVLKFGEFV